MIAEVASVMTSPRVYGLEVTDAARLRTVLNLRGVKMHQKRTILAALDLRAPHPKLGFIDTLTATYAQLSGVQLATSDTDIPGKEIPTSPVIRTTRCPVSVGGTRAAAHGAVGRGRVVPRRCPQGARRDSGRLPARTGR